MLLTNILFIFLPLFSDSVFIPDKSSHFNVHLHFSRRLVYLGNSQSFFFFQISYSFLIFLLFIIWVCFCSSFDYNIYTGAYDNEEAAAHTYDLAALKYWGPGTTLNFPVH
jgi:hypothetical protein